MTIARGSSKGRSCLIAFILLRVAGSVLTVPHGHLNTWIRIVSRSQHLAYAAKLISGFSTPSSGWDRGQVLQRHIRDVWAGLWWFVE